MRKFFFPLIAILGWTSCSTTQTSVHSSAKNDSLQEAIEAVPQIYRATYTRYADLIHTKLEITPDWKTTQVAGKATIQLKQHFYTSDSVRLNAKGMDIHQVCLLKKEGQKIPLKYSYADNMLRIQLDRMYTKDEDFLMFIDYTAKPEEVKGGGSAAIRDDKGFYFINPDGKLPDKPKEFWTQGETESNSVWFPTIESPDQKMTQEIYITVDSNYKTLSNGLLLSSTNHPDGTRTDYWKQSLPAAPYLTMIAAGDYAIVKDKWKSIELSYYVDPPYEKYARMIFGNTPEMMDFFSRLLGVDYPWEKFAQIVVHDYISGAMENTTAVVHGTSIQQDSGEYIDGNYEDYISHELFHHWFGDLVTCESWSNLTLNEGFADYSEYLWREHKFGRDDADRQNQSEQASYMYATAKDEPALLRFTYDDKEDMYDAISYNKGGRVLHMLRKYVGDSAFFASLKLYLDTKRFSSAEVNDLRMAFEQITGEDLNWYFNQWFVFPGKPSLSISYAWDEVNSQQSILLRQTQDFSKNTLYRIPLDVDFYYNNK
ncbi:MAG TPA: M1 family metallopeptidase, partial [Bacteroidia bacterium]|nr:M1 family metallopeptidase [Bacteroidia bacterium]